MKTKYIIWPRISKKKNDTVRGGNGLFSVTALHLETMILRPFTRKDPSYKCTGFWVYTVFARTVLDDGLLKYQIYPLAGSDVSDAPCVSYISTVHSETTNSYFGCLHLLPQSTRAEAH